MEDAISKLPPVVLVAAYAAFWGWEALLSARERTSEPRRRGRNLALSAIGVAIAGASGTGVLWLSALVASQGWGLLSLANLPLWVTTLAGILLLERLHHLRAIERRLPQPALAVASDPRRVRQSAQALDRLARPRRPGGEVPAEEIAVGTGGLRVLQHLLECGQVPVDVVKDSEHA
jgi:MFS family permease